MQAVVSSLRALLVGLTSVLFVANLVQSFFYLPASDAHDDGGHMRHGLYYLCFVAFFAAMIFALLAPSLPLMWVAVELTTLVSAPLIAYHRTKGALEAMWKYLLICSIGIGLALFGTMLVLHAQDTGNALWYKAGFVFILCGYGTKTGLAPFHTWLPDAHSEAPAPVSALLSGALLNCSLFAIVRFRAVMPEEIADFCDGAMLSLGLLSVAVAAIFMARQSDYKRLLAYSSVEHMGLILTMLVVTLKVSVDSDAHSLVFAAVILHIIAHSLTKTMLFQTAGNLLLAFRTRAVTAVRGLGVSMKAHAVLWIVGTLFICGMPPSLLFASELIFVMHAPLWMSALVLVLLFCVFAAMVKIALSMTMGSPDDEGAVAPVALPKRMLAVPFSLLALLLALACLFSLSFIA